MRIGSGESIYNSLLSADISSCRVVDSWTVRVYVTWLCHGMDVTWRVKSKLHWGFIPKATMPAFQAALTCHCRWQPHMYSLNILQSL